jgi:hypothetical protein
MLSAGFEPVEKFELPVSQKKYIINGEVLGKKPFMFVLFL